MLWIWHWFLRTELWHLRTNQSVKKHILKYGSSMIGEEKLDWSVL
jgi:hypothetical protein